jgi:hypothetical protein
MKISSEDRETLYRELADRLAENTALGPALSGYWHTLTNGGRDSDDWSDKLREWADVLNGEAETVGSDLSLSSMAVGILPPVEVAFIRIAETEKGADVAGFQAAAAYAHHAQKYEESSLSLFWNLIPWSFLTWAQFGTTTYTQHILNTQLGTPITYSGWTEAGLGLAAAVTWLYFPILSLALLVKLASYWFLPNWTGPNRRWCDQNLPGFRGYARQQGLGILSGLAFVMTIGKTAADALEALHYTATPWLRSYIEPLQVFCKGHDNNLVAGLHDLGGTFPSATLVRRLTEAAKSPNFAERQTIILNREVDKASAGNLRAIERTNEGAMYLVSLLALVSIVIDYFVQFAIDDALNLPR